MEKLELMETVEINEVIYLGKEQKKSATDITAVNNKNTFVT